MGLPFLAKVYGGWSGSIVIGYGALSTTVGARVRESWVSFWARVVADCYVELGLALTVEMIAADTARVSAPGVFTMTLSGTLGAATDFDSGPYSGASSYTSDANTPPNVVVVDEILVDTADLVLRPGRPASNGGGAAAGLDAGAPVGVLIATTPAAAWTLESALSGVYDVAYDSRIFARARIDGWSRRPVGRRRDVCVTLEAQAQAVAE